jgi:haloalkane dehalogenase
MPRAPAECGAMLEPKAGVQAPPSLAERTFELDPGSFPFESRFVDVDRARVHYIDEGSGPVLLLLHGNPTWCYVFRHLIDLLKGRFRCIAPDLPGFGLSVAPPDYDFLPESHAQIVSSFVCALGLESFTPVVQDWGGPIGLSVAARFSDRVERLVIGNTWSWPVNGDVHFEWFSRLMGGPIGKLFIRRCNAFVNVFVPAGIKRKKVDADFLKAYRRPLPTPERRMPSYIFPRSILHSHAFLARCETALDLLKDKPALIVWGDADIAFRCQEREHFENVLTSHRTVILRGAGHYVWEDAPDEIATAISQWWDDT